MLTGASVQSSNGNNATGSGLVQQRDSDAGDQNGQPNSAAKAQDQVQGETDSLQSPVTQAVPRSNTGQAVAPQPQVRSNASGTSRAAGREDKTPPVSLTIIANAALPASVPPVEIMPVSALPVPSPSTSEQREDNAETGKDETNNGVTGVQTEGDSNRASRVTHIAGNSQDATTAQDSKVAPESSDVPDSSALQSGTPVSGSTACATGFSLPAGITPIALPLSSTTISSVDFLPSISDAGQLTANTAQGSKTGASSLLKSATANVAGAIGTTQPTSSATPAIATAHNAQNTIQDNPTAQHGQGQAVQTTPATQGQANSTSPQMQAITAHGATHEAPDVNGRTAGSGAGTHASEALAQVESNESATAAGINTANVIQKMNETEMRVGMHSADFGEISIRTSVSQQQMMAQISVDHGDLGKEISAHIPAMEAKLGGEFGLRAVVQVNQSGMSFAGERGYSPQREQRSSTQPLQAEGVPAVAEIDSAAPRVAALASDGYRLDIRA